MRRIRDWLAQFKNHLQPDLFGWEDDSVAPVSHNPHHNGASAPTPKASPNSTSHSKKTATESVRTAVLGEQVVPYRLERARRKTVGMMVDAQGLRVRASPYVSVSEIERILHSKSNWILRHLSPSPHADTPSRHRSFMPDLSVADGETLRLLGRTVQIRWGTVQQLPDAALSEQIVWVKRPRTRAGAREADIRASYQNALANALGDYLLAYLHQRAQWYAQHHGLRYRDIVLSNAKTLWGTCRRDGLIRMNWRLVFLDEALVDYVLAHELAHTVQMNHSAVFWTQVARMCPDYKNLRRQLKQFDLRGA